MTLQSQAQQTTLHGNRVSYRLAGEGPLLVLVHGITSSSESWAGVMPWLSERFTVLAPDLPGHGFSDKPRGDYSLGAYASGIRDLLLTLGHERATFVGHSLGGGVAMQLAYQFPERCERLALVSSGGLGQEVHPLLRAAALPGSEWVLPVIAGPKLRDAGAAVGGLLGRLGLRPGPDVAEFARGYASLADREAREAFVHTLRSVIDPSGQRVSARDRLYLAAEVPTLIAWGERDRIIPVRHGHAAHEQMPGSRLEVFPDAGHFPHHDDPHRFVKAIEYFMDSTEPARLDPDQLRERLLAGPETSR